MKYTALVALLVAGCSAGDTAVDTTSLGAVVGESTCRDFESLIQGCSVTVPPPNWTQSYRAYATENGIAQSGALVHFYPAAGSENPLDKVVAIVGPHVSTQSLSSTDAERAWLRRDAVAPFMTDMDRFFADNGISVLYIGFGHEDNSQQPTSQRVYAAKRALAELRRVRRRVLPDASRPKIALMGLSLGGVVGKIALNDLESEFGHDVGLFVTVDSPHWGAYTPPGLQNIPIFLEEAFRYADRKLDNGFFEGLVVGLLDGFGFINADQARDPIARARDYIHTSLKSPLGQELLMVNLAYPNGSAPGISSFQAEALNVPGQTTQNVAVVSGSISNEPLPLGDTFFDFHTPELSTRRGQLEMRMASRIPTAADTEYFYGQFRFREIGRWSDSTWTDSQNNVTQDVVRRLERAPCSYQEKLVDELVERLGPQFASTWSGFQLRANERKACTVPSFSAMATVGGSTSPSSSVFDRVIGDSTNKAHLAVSSAMLGEIRAVFAQEFDVFLGSASDICVAPPWLPQGVFSSDNHIYYSNGDSAYCECPVPVMPGFDICAPPTDMAFHNVCTFECDPSCRPREAISEGAFNVGEETYYSNGQDQYCRCPNPIETGRWYCEFPVGRDAPTGICTQRCSL